MWISHGVGSADGAPTPEQIEHWHRRIAPPQNEFPADGGVSVLLGRTDDAAVGLAHVEAFSTGFRFTLSVRLRQRHPSLAGGGLFMLIGPHIRPDMEVPLENRLLLGIEYVDGRRASTLNDPRMDGPGAVIDDQQLVLVAQGGGGGDLEVDQDLWVAPLPPDGPVTVVLTWPGFGIAESRTILDGALIRAAAARTHLLWPSQPLAAAAEPPAQPRPSTGWFAEPVN